MSKKRIALLVGLAMVACNFLIKAYEPFDSIHVSFSPIIDGTFIITRMGVRLALAILSLVCYVSALTMEYREWKLRRVLLNSFNDK